MNLALSEADFGVALLLFLVTLLFAIYNWLGPLRNERRKTYRYSLFAIRDRLVLLVAKNQLAEDDEVFQFLYRFVNLAIPRAEPLNLREFVGAIRTTKLDDDDFRRRIVESINHKDEAIRDVARAFFSTLMSIIIAKSWLVKISAYCTRSSIQLFSLGRKVLPRVFKTQSEAYELHKDLQSLRKLTA